MNTEDLCKRFKNLFFGRILATEYDSWSYIIYLSTS